MVNPQELLDGRLEGLSASISVKVLLNFAALSLALDSALAYWFHSDLLSLDLEWTKANLSVGAILLVFTAYALSRVWLLPWLRFFIGLPFLFGTEYLIRRFLPRSHDRIGVREEEFLAFSIVSNNSVAYEEYRHQKEDRSSQLEVQELAIAVSVLLAVNLLVRSDSPTLAQRCIAWMAGLSAIPFALLSLLICFLMFSLVALSIIVTRFQGAYLPLFSVKLREAMGDFLEYEKRMKKLDELEAELSENNRVTRWKRVMEILEAQENQDIAEHDPCTGRPTSPSAGEG